MERLTDLETASIAGLSLNSQFQVFVDYLKKELQIVDKKNRVATDDQLKWSQGQAQVLQEILSAIENSKEVLSARRNKRKV